MTESTKLEQGITYSIILIILGIIISVGITILSDQKNDVCSQPGVCTSTTTTSTTIYNYTINFNDNRMLLYYSFDANNTNDDSSHGINGIDGNTINISGKIGSARYFNFSNITIPDVDLLGFRNHNFTISYWVNKTSGFGDQMIVFNSCRTCFDSGYSGYYAGLYPALILGWDSGTPNFFASEDQVSWLANALPLGYVSAPYDQWEMYTIIGNGSSLKTYQANILVTDLPAPNYDFDLQNGTNMMIGYQVAAAFGGNQLIGGVDEFFYLNRSLNQAELDCVYNAGVGQSLRTPVNCTAYGATSGSITINTTTTTGNPDLIKALTGTQNALATFAGKTSLLSTVVAALIILGIIYYFGVRKQ